MNDSLCCSEFDQEEGVFDDGERVAAHHGSESGELCKNLLQASISLLPGHAALKGGGPSLWKFEVCYKFVVSI